MYEEGGPLNYKQWMQDDLRDLERLRFSIGQMESELKTIAAETAAIRATSYDKLPGSKGVNVQEERLLNAMARKEELTANLRATRRRVADLDRLLMALPREELRVVQVMLISGEKGAVERLSEELGYESAQIYRLKDRAIANLAQLRWGVGFRT